MAENSLNKPPSKKKKTDTAAKDVDHDLSGQCEATGSLTQDREQTLIVPKRKKQKDDGWPSNGTAVCITSASSTENPTTSSGLKNSLHGNVFQLKLLMLFLIRGIASNYQFNLGTEIPGLGGKFDDLIFKYSLVKDGEVAADRQSERYRYLQAKHKQNEKSETITAADLLQDNNGEFSLPKYFRSYCRDVIKRTEGILPENVQDCIICTNIGFDSEHKLKNSGIELILLDDYDQILTFNKVPNTEKTPTRYKLRKTDQLRRIMAGWSDIHLLAKTLLEYVTDNKKLTVSSPIFKQYHIALVEENIISKEDRKLSATFLQGGGNQFFREILSEITFVHYWEKLKFKRDDRKRSRVDSRMKLTHFDETSLNKQLPKYPQSNKPQIMELNFDIFEDFYDDLIAENIIDAEGRKANKKLFTDNFLHGINLFPEGLKLRGKLRNAVFIHYWKVLTIQLSVSFGRKIISSTPDENKSLNDSVGDKEINDFLDKLVFAVHTPNEVELDCILKNEVSDRYSLNESDFQSDFILRNMLDWFKEKESKFMTSQEGKDILEKGGKKMKSLRMTAISIDYQKQLKEVLEFNDKAVEEMKDKMMKLLIAPDRIGRIATLFPKRTAVKVIAALEKLRLEEPINQNTTMLQEYFQRKDSYLVTSSSRLQKDRSKFKKSLKSENSHNLLVVVCEDGTSTENDDELHKKLVKKLRNKRIIIISQGGAEVEDKLNFGDLSEKSKRALLEKQIEFHGTLQSVEDLIKRGDTTLDDLIENNSEKVLDCNSIEELLIDTGKVTIPTCSSARFEPLLYIERHMKFPWNNHCYDQLAKKLDSTTDELQKEFAVSSQGNVEWFTALNQRKKEIWEKMQTIFKNSNQLLDPISENSLIMTERNWRKRVIIICGLAGTGKSTILSNFYEKIKKETPHHWIIRIDLVDYCQILSTFNFNTESSAISFFVNHLPGIQKSSFARSLLTHRLQTDGRIVVMLDGFDEIDSKIHRKIYQLIKAIRSLNFDTLFITTRSHLREKLQDQLCQFAHTFENFSNEDQVNYLSKYWMSKLDTLQHNEHVTKFAEVLVSRVSETLKDENRDFIGIPLQCRILAECFETVQEIISQGSTIDSLIQTIDKDFWDLASLYRRLMKRKLDIYRQEKIQDQAHNHRTKSHIDTDMVNLEFYLRELAIQTIFLKPKDVRVLLGTDKQLSFHQSEAELEEQKGKQADDCVCFGLLDKNAEGKVQFLHRTYAEYLVAEYIYKGFHLDDKRHNRLLGNEPVRGLMIKILAYRLYEGVQVFINSMFKEIVDQDGKWREIIDNRLKNKFPDRFKIFTKQWKSSGSAQRFFEHTIGKQNGKIFKFFCDCFDVMFDPSEFRQIMKSIYNRNSRIAVDFYTQSSEVFERFIKYYDTADQSEVKNIFEVMLVQRLSRRSLDNNAFQTWNLLGAYPYWKEKEKRKVVELVLDFLVKHQKMSKEIKIDLISEDIQMMDILHFFVSNEYYDCLLRKWLELLLSMYCDDDEFIVTQCKLLLAGIYSKYYKNYKKEVNMGKMLTVLRDLGLYQLLERISRPVLLWDSHIFGTIYQPNETVEGTRQLLSSWTLFQRVAFDGDTAAVVSLLENKAEECKAELLKNTEGDSSMAEKEEDDEVIEDDSSIVGNDMVRDNEEITPFYIAVATGHKEMCHKLLAFLKQSLTDDELKKALTDTAGLVHCALRDAINFQRLKMFELILTAIKRELGHNCLLDLLKSEYPNNGERQTLYYGSAFAIGRFEERDSKLWLQTMIDIVLRSETEEHQNWNGLSELVLQDKYSIRSLYYIDNGIFKEMLKSKGLQLWIQLLLDIDIYKGFNLLCYENSDFEKDSHSLEPEPSLPCPLRMFDEFELSEFIAIFTSTIDDEGNLIKSYWEELLNFNLEMMEFGQEDAEDMGYSYRHNDALAESLSNFFECIYEKLSKREVNERLFDNKGIEAITQSMLLNITIEGENPIDNLVEFIQDCQDEEIKQHLMSKMPLAIEIVMGIPNQFGKLSQGIVITRLTIADLVLENARYSLQLPILVDALLEKQEDDRKKRSIWSYYFKYCDRFKYKTLPKRMGKFLKLVSEKHENGSKKVKELVLQQYDGEGSVTAIRRAKLTRRPALVKTMLAHLNEEDREDVRFHVDTIEEYEDSSDSWDEEMITNSDEFLATSGN